MGIAAEDIPVVREDVRSWLVQWALLPSPRPKQKKYIADQMDAKYGEGTADTMVDTTEHASLSDETKLIDMVWDDIGSYA